MTLQAHCPECGAYVPLVRERWLHVHNEGSPSYTFPGPDRPRCPGSFLMAVRTRPARQPREAQAKPVSR